MTAHQGGRLPLQETTDRNRFSTYAVSQVATACETLFMRRSLIFQGNTPPATGRAVMSPYAWSVEPDVGTAAGLVDTNFAASIRFDSLRRASHPWRSNCSVIRT